MAHACVLQYYGFSLEFLYFTLKCTEYYFPNIGIIGKYFITFINHFENLYTPVFVLYSNIKCIISHIHDLVIK